MSVTSVNKRNRPGAVSVAGGDGAAAALERLGGARGAKARSSRARLFSIDPRKEREEARPVLLDWIFYRVFLYPEYEEGYWARNLMISLIILKIR
jgi:hypothetical protein